MKPVKPYVHAAIVVIVILLGGCDNVGWGGANVAIVPPPQKATALPEGAAEAGVEPLPSSPILYYVVRTADGAFLTPVGAISGDSLTPIRSAGDAKTFGGRFIAEFMRQGAEFTLFAGGRRAGTFLVETAELPTTPTCPLLPTAKGSLEMSSNVAETEFLALARSDAPSVQARTGRPALLPRIRIVAPILAERMIRKRGAELPGNWMGAMEQLTAIPISGQPNAAFTATFLVGDTLGPGMDNDGYSLFFIGVPTANQTGYDSVYVNYRNYAETGKAAPRVIDFLDWTRDDSPEILMQVFGVSDSWFEAVGKDASGNWRRIFRDRCEEGGRSLKAPAVADSAAPDTAAGR